MDKPEFTVVREDNYWGSGQMHVAIEGKNGRVRIASGLTADKANKEAIKAVRRLLKELESYE